MQEFTFRYRGGEIYAYVEAETQYLALEKVIYGDDDVDYEVDGMYTHSEFWENITEEVHSGDDSE